MNNSVNAIDNRLSARLKELRKERNLSLTEIAMKINVSAETLKKWENGKQDPRSAKAFGFIPNQAFPC